MRRPWFDTSRQLAFVFVAVLVPAAATLVWLGLRLLEQDRILWAQREVERQEAAADAIVRTLAQMIADAERQLADGRATDGAVLLTRSGDRIVASAPAMLAWVPAPAFFGDATDRLFEPVEKDLEFQPRKAGAALRAYRRMARSADPAVRAGALLRSARVHLKTGRLDAAVADYGELRKLGAVTLTGLPADLVARRAVCAAFAEAHRTDELESEARTMEADLSAGRWALDRDGWELTASDLGRWLGRPVDISDSRVAISRAAEWFRNTAPSGAGRHLIEDVTLVWRESGAVAIPSAELDRWVSMSNSYPADALSVALVDAGGDPVAGAPPAASALVSRRPAADTGLPWTVVAAAGPRWSTDEELTTRRHLLTAGLAALGILLGGGSYLIWRVVQRELAIARLQAEFVSAVSHEFRTPVTSLRHMIELLQEDDELTRERRRSFYDVLARSTDRLHRLVESLLDFARMESGRKPYDLRPLEPAALATGVAGDFAADPASCGYAIDVRVDPGTPREIRADADALTHAVWNLLDNAVKYSPGRRRIGLRVSPHSEGLAISVTDEGLGVPSRERGEIFLKFVRGEKARRHGIKGTGVGLAIVSHIVRAHGGQVEVDSEEGEGSTFRIVLPTTP